MTDSSIRPIGSKKPKGKAVATAAIVIIVLCAGYLWLARTHADFRPGMWVRLNKASLFSFSKQIYAKSFHPMESEERLYLFNNPFIESEANLIFFVQYDKNLGGVQRLVLKLGGIKYHIYKGILNSQGCDADHGLLLIRPCRFLLRQLRKPPIRLSSNHRHGCRYSRTTQSGIRAKKSIFRMEKGRRLSSSKVLRSPRINWPKPGSFLKKT